MSIFDRQKKLDIWYANKIMKWFNNIKAKLITISVQTQIFNDRYFNHTKSKKYRPVIELPGGIL